MEKSKSVQKLILLIGSNPMPNFISVLMFKPQKVWFCYTPQTKDVKKRLQSVLNKKYTFESKEIYISDAGDSEAVRKAFQEIDIDENTYLNYTGGTKVMAAQARMIFKEIGGQHSHAFYVYDRETIIRFDNGREIAFKDINWKFEIKDILSLHNIEIDNQKIPTEEEIELSREIANFILNLKEEDIAQNKNESELKRKFQGKYSEVSESFFRRGDWLEIWTERLIGGLIREDANSSIHVSLYCRRENRLFEIDVVAIYKHRIYVISCTISHKLDKCKSKLFEVALRSRQLGGDLARSAFVCLIYGEDDQGAYIDQLRNDIKDFWDTPNTPRVFGLDHLREWMNGRLKSLKEWLEN
jgi:hypothetical protein